MRDRFCPDCDAVMERGYLPEITQNGWHPSKWHPGEPKQHRILGIPTGLKISRRALLPLTAYRCPECHLVKLYAPPPEDD